MDRSILRVEASFEVFDFEYSFHTFSFERHSVTWRLEFQFTSVLKL
ncbi:hypothetical protein ARMA_0789 [Ardenticatena maritima]|uniref:Uncharacterized protein n=1 Tax=Ardenticatena maritima TaxID=872965 RepID=A0A0M8K8D1_9CHLR|nr:hypothetical protein ARMA_0789 [Ardenticatena maritima]